MDNNTINNGFTEAQNGAYELRFNELEEAKELFLSKIQKYDCTSIEDCADINPLSKGLEQEDTAILINLKNQCTEWLKQKKELERTIYITPSKRAEIVNTAVNLLITHRECGIYIRSGRLVRIVQVPTIRRQKNGVRGSSVIATIEDLDQASLTLLFDSIGIFLTYDKQLNSYKQIDFPERFARFILTRRDWQLPILTGIIYAPTLREDGSILDKDGYDEVSGICFISGGWKFKPVSEHPIKDDAIKAVSKLKYILKDFPFDNTVSESVIIAAILTALIRKSLPTAPLFCISAPTMATGKSLLGEIISIIATGEVCSAIPQAENEAEEKKRILALLKEGSPFIHMDNIDKLFGSAALCSVLTQSEYQDRILGSTETISVSTNTMMIANGNNLTVSGDMSTRVLLATLDAQEERPEERSFEITDLRAYIRENRAELVDAGITILRSFHVAGYPSQGVKTYGRFEVWSNRVREAVIWIGEEDPCKSRAGIEKTDPIRITLGNLFTSWFFIFGSMPVKITQIEFEAITNSNRDDYRDLLKEAIFDLAADYKGVFNRRVFGRKLSIYKNRIESGYRLEQEGRSQGITLWSIKKIAKKTTIAN